MSIAAFGLSTMACALSDRRSSPRSLPRRGFMARALRGARAPVHAGSISPAAGIEGLSGLMAAASLASLAAGFGKREDAALLSVAAEGDSV